MRGVLRLSLCRCLGAAGIVKDVTSVHPEEWFGQQAVYRISMGNCVSWPGRVEGGRCVVCVLFVCVSGKWAVVGLRACAFW